MSEFRVNFTKIKEIAPHPDPETTSLEIATVYDFQVIIRKGQYLADDFVLYIPIDSVLPSDFESIIFGVDSKIKLQKGRVKQIRIRKFYSQGMLVSVSDVQELLKQRGLAAKFDFKLEHDYSELLGVTKYEPPTPSFQLPSQKTGGRKQNADNPLFHSFNGIENIKWLPDAFKDGEEVVIQEKTHGTHGRASKLPALPRTIYQKFLKLIGLFPKYENCFGSNRVELTHKKDYKGYYGEDLYGAAFKRCDAFSKIKENEIIYGEIVGEGIQKNYHYGHKEPTFILFDVKVIDPATKDYRWLNPEEVEAYANERGFTFVPVLYKGPYNKQLASELVTGDSVYCPAQKVREGIVIKSRHNLTDSGYSSKKKMLKWISPEYLAKDNTDFH